MELCSVGIMGTQYVREVPLPETLEITLEGSTILKIPNIYSAIPIGNQLDINLRQSLGNELSFVTLTEHSGQTIVNIDAKDLQVAEYKLILESFDQNSSVKSTLKTDEITIRIIDPNKNCSIDDAKLAPHLDDLASPIELEAK